MNSIVRTISVDRTVSADDFRGAMRHLTGGVSVITAGRGRDVSGMTVTSVSSLSVDPPSLIVSINRTASSWPLIQRHGAFGVNILTADQVERVRREGYRPAEYANGNPELRDVLALIADGHFSRGDRSMFRPLVENLLQADPFLVLADYADYAACQERVNSAWQDPRRWTRMSIFNTARAGKFPVTSLRR